MRKLVLAFCLVLATPAAAAGPCNPSDIEIKQLDRLASKDWGDDAYYVVGELVNRCRTRASIDDFIVAFGYGGGGPAWEGILQGDSLAWANAIRLSLGEADPNESLPFAAGIMERQFHAETMAAKVTIVSAAEAPPTAWCTASDIQVKQVKRGISLPIVPGTFVVRAAAENRCKAPTYFEVRVTFRNTLGRVVYAKQIWPHTPPPRHNCNSWETCSLETAIPDAAYYAETMTVKVVDVHPWSDDKGK
jgi:hypothetical protein